MSETILTQAKGPIFEITLNRPDKRNALHAHMLSDLAEAVGMADKNPDARLIVVRGAGKAFSSGIDLMIMGGSAEMFGDDWAQRPHEITRHWQRCIGRLAESPLPTLALLHGYCIGAGLELALACDFRYVAHETRISIEETRIGLIPDVGGITRLMKLIGPSRAKEIILTGRRIDPETSHQWGMVNRIIAIEEFDSAATELAEEISLCAPLAVAAAKRVIQATLDEAMGLHMEGIEQATLLSSEDLQEGVQAALQRRTPQWKRR